MNYRIGLDIGITSVGWATILLDDVGVPYRIGKLGVRIFDKPENPKDGSSLAAPRRAARSMRRRLRRHKHRLDRIKQLYESEGLLKRDELEALHHSGRELQDIFELRTAGLERQLSEEEWTRVLVHIAQRRGFKSNRKNPEAASEDGKLLEAVKSNRKLMDEHGYRTIGEMFCKDNQFREVSPSTGLITRKTRNKASDYSHTVPRELILEEAKLLFGSQRKFGNLHASLAFETKYIDILSGQRNFDEGPGEGSPYAGNLIEKMVGTCTFFKDEKRASKASYSFERFMLLTKINNLRLVTGKQTRTVTQEERELLIAEAYKKNDLKYANVRKLLQLSDDTLFKGLFVGKKSVEEVEKSTKFVELKNYHELRKALSKVSKDEITTIDPIALDEVARILTYYKNEENIERELRTTSLSADQRNAVMSVSFSKFGHLSIKALRLITPHLELGLDYDKACDAAGIQFQGVRTGDRLVYLPRLDSDAITNPVVKRALAQSIMVVNAIIRENGSPESVHIELAREMADNFTERKKSERTMDDNRTRNDRVKEKIVRELGVTQPRGEDIVKMKLYEEQDGVCMYSGEKMDIRRIFTEPGYADVDHIIPYSISFDDSYKNKVLVLGRENRQKGNKLPIQYLSVDPTRVERFKALVHSKRETISYNKRLLLLKEELDPAELEGFKDRNLVDTRYITKELSNHIRQYLKFAEVGYEKKKRTLNVNGPITAYVRKRWGLNKNRDFDDLHHAMDAVVVACVDDGLIQRITAHHKYKENLATSSTRDEGLKHYPQPWPYFRDELLARLSGDPMHEVMALELPNYYGDEDIRPIFVSRAPRRKIGGQAHQETFRSAKYLESDGITVAKTPLTKLKLNKDGEIDGYFNKESDRLLYAALVQRLKQFNGDGTKAFAEPFYKPTSSGAQGPLVKSVKLTDKATLGVPVLHGNALASNGSMLRIDVFQKNNKYFWVPIYAADVVKPELPNRAVVAAKRYEEWEIMDATSEFLFSLYPNDLLKVTFKGEKEYEKSNLNKIKISEIVSYYKGGDISTGGLLLIAHDNSFTLRNTGVKILPLIEKYQVDVLGNLSKVKKERRQEFRR